MSGWVTLAPAPVSNQVQGWLPFIRRMGVSILLKWEEYR